MLRGELTRAVQFLRCLKAESFSSLAVELGINQVPKRPLPSNETAARAQLVSGHCVSVQGFRCSVVQAKERIWIQLVSLEHK
jgi:hypothetical protein